MIIFKIILILLFCGCVRQDKNLQVSEKEKITYHGSRAVVKETDSIKEIRLNVDTGHVTHRFLKDIDLKELQITVMRKFCLDESSYDLGVDGQYDVKMNVFFLKNTTAFQLLIWFEGDWLEISNVMYSLFLLGVNSGVQLNNECQSLDVLDEELADKLDLSMYSYLYTSSSGLKIAYDFKKLRWVEYVAEDHYSLGRRYKELQKNVK